MTFMEKLAFLNDSIMKKEYLTILTYTLFAIIVTVLIIGTFYFLAKQNPDEEKLSADACKFEHYNDVKRTFDLKKNFMLLKIFLLVILLCNYLAFAVMYCVSSDFSEFSIWLLLHKIFFYVLYFLKKKEKYSVEVEAHRASVDRNLRRGLCVDIVSKKLFIHVLRLDVPALVTALFEVYVKNNYMLKIGYSSWDQLQLDKQFLSNEEIFGFMQWILVFYIWSIAPDFSKNVSPHLDAVVHIIAFIYFLINVARKEREAPDETNSLFNASESQIELYKEILTNRFTRSEKETFELLEKYIFEISYEKIKYTSEQLNFFRLALDLKDMDSVMLMIIITHHPHLPPSNIIIRIEKMETLLALYEKNDVENLIVELKKIFYEETEL